MHLVLRCLRCLRCLRRSVVCPPGLAGPGLHESARASLGSSGARVTNLLRDKLPSERGGLSGLSGLSRQVEKRHCILYTSL